MNLKIVFPLFCILISCTLSPFSTAADSNNGASLYQVVPESWRAEVISFPLPFAPDLPLEGVEELRFAPGMFEAESDTYFTYTFIWWLTGERRFAADEMERLLLEYFGGLYLAVSKKEEKDVSGFRVGMEAMPAPVGTEDDRERYQGRVDWIDPLVTEEELVLNLKVWRWYCDEEDRTAVFFALSPRPTSDGIWESMEKQKAGQCREEE